MPKTSILTNGYMSKFFNISRSARQGCPASPLIYIIQVEPLACTIRANKDIKGISLPDPEIKETKLNIFADDTQLLLRTEKLITGSI